MKWRNVTIAK